MQRNLITHAAKGIEGLAGQRIARFDVQGFLEATHRLTVHFLAKIGAAEIVVMKMARLVAAGFDGLLQPGNGFVELGEFD